jgi:hypothetical protein
MEKYISNFHMALSQDFFQVEEDHTTASISSKCKPKESKAL